MTNSQVIVLGGPSGAGKSRLAARLGLPVLRLDDFYHTADADGLPRIVHGANHGLVDWDDPRSWDQQQAFEAVRRLCATGTTEVPVYDISTSSRLGSRVMDLGDEERFVAEGIFAPEIVAACQREGLLLAAYCITQHPLRTFRRRLVRDLRERRKPPLVLLRRGLALLRGQRAVVAHARTRGCTVATSDEAFSQLRASTPVNAPIAGRDSGTLPP